jgi:hypothetical protein
VSTVVVRPPGLTSRWHSLAAQLARADYYAKLGNWDAAGPIFRRLEREFASLNDPRDALYSHVSRLEADIESANLHQVSDELAQIIGRPEVQKGCVANRICELA